MRVTRVNLRTDLMLREGSSSRLIACGSVELDGELRIEYIRVVRTNDGRILVAMPSHRNSAGAHRDLVHPVVQKLRDEIHRAVMDEVTRCGVLTEIRPGVTIATVRNPT